MLMKISNTFKTVVASVTVLGLRGVGIEVWKGHTGKLFTCLLEEFHCFGKVFNHICKVSFIWVVDMCTLYYICNIVYHISGFILGWAI